MISITYSKRDGYIVKPSGKRGTGYKQKTDALMFVSDYLTKEKRLKK
jgi:hypothetical protein